MEVSALLERQTLMTRLWLKVKWLIELKFSLFFIFNFSWSNLNVQPCQWDCFISWTRPYKYGCIIINYPNVAINFSYIPQYPISKVSFLFPVNGRVQSAMCLSFCWLSYMWVFHYVVLTGTKKDNDSSHRNRKQKKLCQFVFVTITNFVCLMCTSYV